MRLTFSEPVRPVGRGIGVVAPSGRSVERGVVRASGTELAVDVDAAEPGTYVVTWRIVSVDAQPERGRFAFSIGPPTTTAASAAGDGVAASRVGPAVGIVGRALHFLGYALAFGVLAFRRIVLHPRAIARGDAPDRKLWRLTRLGLAALVLAEPLVLLGHALRLGVAGDLDVLADVLASRVGLVAGQRLGFALLLWAMLTALEAGSGFALDLALALGVVLAIIDGQAVHALGVRPLAVGLVTNAVHVVAMGAWVGTLSGLLATWPAIRDDTRRAALARRAGLMATVALLLALGSGVLLSLQHLTTTSDLAATAYGRVLATKLATLIVVLALALAAWRSRAPERWWRRELVALTGLLLVAAALVSLAPPA